MLAIHIILGFRFLSEYSAHPYSIKDIEVHLCSPTTRWLAVPGDQAWRKTRQRQDGRYIRDKPGGEGGEEVHGYGGPEGRQANQQLQQRPCCARNTRSFIHHEGLSYRMRSDSATDIRSNNTTTASRKIRTTVASPLIISFHFNYV